jgi:O-antigen/teichoic acid export membrane protein
VAGSHLFRLTMYLLLGVGRREPDSPDQQPLLAWVRRECLPFWWQTVLTVAGSQLPVVLIRARAGLEDVAHFDAANKVALALTLVISSLSSVLLPRLAALDDAPGRALFDRVLVLGTAGFALIAAVVSAASPLVVDLLYGSAFGASVAVLRLQVWAAAAAIVFNVLGTAMAARGHERSLARLGTAYTAVLIGSVTVGAGWGATGAAMGFAVAGVVNLGYHRVVFARVTGWAVPHAVIAGFVAAAAWSVVVAPHLPLVASFGLPVLCAGAGLAGRVRAVWSPRSLTAVEVGS